MPLTRDETRGSGLALAIDLVNTWDELEPEPDLIEGLEDVRTWLEWHGLPNAAKALGEADVDRVRALRTRSTSASPRAFAAFGSPCHSSQVRTSSRPSIRSGSGSSSSQVLTRSIANAKPEPRVSSRVKGISTTRY